MKYASFLFINFACINCSVLYDNVKTLEMDRTIIPSGIITNYLHKYVNCDKVFLSISFSSTNNEQEYFQEDLLNNLMKQAKLDNFSYNILDKVDPYRKGNKYAFNLIFVDESKSLKNILNDSTTKAFHVLQHFLIVVTQGLQNIADNLNAIFATLMELGLLDVNVLIKNEYSSIWSLHSYKPYVKNCNSFNVIQLETFSLRNYTKESEVPLNNLYPQRQIKFPKCNLIISSFPIEPYVIVSNPPNGTIKYRGIDVTIISEISKKLNLIPIFVQPPDNKKRGSIFPNGTATGAVRMTIDGVSNMTMGSFALTLDRVRAMAMSHSYMQSAFVFVSQRTLIPSSPLWKLMAPFQSCLWISIAILLCASVVIILLSRKLSTRQRHFIIGGHMNRTPIMNMFTVLIGNVIPNPRMQQQKYFSVFARTLAILWIFFWLIVRNSYQGSLFQFLRDQRGSLLYDIVKKVRDSDVNINVISSAVSLIPEGFDDKRFVQHEENDFVAIDKIKSGEWNGVVFTNDITVNYYFLVTKSWRQITYTFDVVRPHTPVFYFNAHSILVWMFNRKIEACNESGLTFYWSMKYRVKPRRIGNKQPKKLQINNILVMIQILAIMYTIAFIVFVFELLSRSHRQIKRFVDYLTY